MISLLIPGLKKIINWQNIADNQKKITLFQTNTPYYLDVVDFLLRNKGNPDTPTYFGKKSLLHVACQEPCLPRMQLLLLYDADINIKDHQGNTPLHTASLSNYADCIEFLLHSKANPSILNHDHKTPLMIAIQKDMLLCSTLLYAWLSPEQRLEERLHTPLPREVQKICASFFLSINANNYYYLIKQVPIEFKNRFLHEIINKGSINWIKKLLSYNADPQSREFYQLPAPRLHSVIPISTPTALTLVTRHGKNTYDTDWMYNTVLQTAILRSNLLQKINKILEQNIPHVSLRSPSKGIVIFQPQNSDLCLTSLCAPSRSSTQSNIHRLYQAESPTTILIMLATLLTQEEKNWVLRIAVQRNYYALAQSLLTYHIDINNADNIDGKGNTLLHWAVLNNNPLMVELLLSNGFALLSHNKEGLTPYNLCNYYVPFDTKSYTQNHKIKILLQNHYGLK